MSNVMFHYYTTFPTGILLNLRLPESRRVFICQILDSTVPSSRKRWQRRRFPDAIIAGAKKCGTSTLQTFLTMHPGLEVAPGEVHYFNQPKNHQKGLSWYLSQMPEVADDKVLLEKTPGYFITPAAPKEMSKVRLFRNFPNLI